MIKSQNNVPEFLDNSNVQMDWQMPLPAYLHDARISRIRALRVLPMIQSERTTATRDSSVFIFICISRRVGQQWANRKTASVLTFLLLPPPPLDTIGERVSNIQFSLSPTQIGCIFRCRSGRMSPVKSAGSLTLFDGNWYNSSVCP